MELIEQIKSICLVLLIFLSVHITSITSEEEPKTEEPKLEEPKLEEPKHEEPKLEVPKHEEPKHEEPKHEEPKHEEPKHVEPKHDEGHHAEHKQEGDKSDPLKFAKDVGHIREHLKEQYGFNDEQANEYLKEYDAQTQFFVMHDYDNNTKLDGLELLKSMTHYHDEHEDASHHDTEKSDNSDTLIEFVDMILKDQDYNNDGYIDYPEYISYYSKFDQTSPPDTQPPPPPISS